MNLSANMHVASLGFWLSLWQLHLVVLSPPKDRVGGEGGEGRREGGREDFKNM